MHTILWIVGGIVGLFVLYIVYMVIRTIAAGAGGRTPEGLTASASAAARVRVGDSMVIEVRISNAGPGARTITNVDLEDTFLRGFRIDSIEPTPEHAPKSPKLGTWAFSHKLALPPGESRTVRFHLRATTPGEHRGDASVYVDDDHFKWVACAVATEVFA